jgi:hypothetical protein
MEKRAASGAVLNILAPVPRARGEHALILKKAIDLWSRWFPIFNRARVQFSLLAGIMMPYNTDASTITTLANRKR